MISNELKTAIATAKKAGEILLGYYQTALTPEKKPDNSFVSIADKESQELIEAELKKQFPDYDFLGEESFQSGQDIPKTKTWVVDPLDGTNNFLLGLPHFCISVGLIENHKSILGVIYNPILGDLFYAESGSGLYWNDKKIEAGICPVNSAIVGRYFSFNKTSLPTEHIQLELKHFLDQFDVVRSLGASALDMAYVAVGRANFFWQRGLSIWDIAAADCLLSEAGLDTKNESGEPFDLSKDSSVIVSSNPATEKELITLLNAEN